MFPNHLDFFDGMARKYAEHQHKMETDWIYRWSHRWFGPLVVLGLIAAFMFLGYAIGEWVLP